MTIFSQDVDEVRIIGTILIFVVSIIGAAIPIAVARLWSGAGKKAADDAHSPTTNADGTPFSRSELRRLRKEETLKAHKHQQTLKLIQHLFLALGSGVIVATAILHMLPEGTEAVSVGYEGLQGGDAHAHDAHDDHAEEAPIVDDHDDHDHGILADNAVAASFTIDARRRDMYALDASIDETTTEDHDHDHDANETIDDHADHDHDEAADAAEEEDAHAHGFPWGFLFVMIGLYITFVAECEMHRLLDSYDHQTEDGHGHSHSHGDHDHDHASTEVAVPLTPQEVKEEQAYQKELSDARVFKAKARVMEVAVATHSIIIGVAFGLLTKASTADTLALALIFHQFCEGLAVGATFETASRLAPMKPIVGAANEEEKQALMAEQAKQQSFCARNGHHFMLAVYILIFSLCVPLGIIIGIAVQEGGKDGNSNTSLFVRGAFECFAGGVLIYVGCVEFLGGLFGAHSHSHVAALPDDCSDAEEEAAKEADDDDDEEEEEMKDASCAEPGHCPHHFHLPSVFCDGAAHANPDGTAHNCEATETATRQLALEKEPVVVVMDTTDVEVLSGDGTVKKGGKKDKKKKKDLGKNKKKHEEKPDACDEHNPHNHFLRTDSLFGRIATYVLVLVGAASMAILANWA